MESFVNQIRERAARLRTLVVVGLDPDIARFPEALRTKVLSATSDELVSTVIQEFVGVVIEATAGHAAAFKPQIAFYEQYGRGGMDALENVISALRSRGIPTILDAKRNDIENTASAYANAWLSPLSPLGQRNLQQVDAITLNPYMGSDSVRPFLKVSSTAGVFLLAKTSNPSAGEIQNLSSSSGRTVADIVALMAEKLAEEFPERGPYGRVGLVVGATYPEDASRLRRLAPRALFLMPGVGTQGGSIGAVAAAAGADRIGAFAAVSRAVLYAHASSRATEADWKDQVTLACRSALEDIVTRINKEVAL